MTQDLQIQEASLHVFAAFDVGFEIRMSQIPVLFGSRTRDPVGYNFLNRTIGRDTHPIRISMDPIEIKVQGHRRIFQVYCTFFDLGSLSLELICPLNHHLTELPRLAADLQNSKELLAESRRLAEEIHSIAKPAIVNPDLFPTPSIFTVFNIRRLNTVTRVQTVIDTYGPLIAKTLRLSDEPIGQSEVNRTLNPHITYSDEDIVFTSANVAIVFDETSAEVIDVFELANVQSLELRFIDARLDRTLQGLYEETEQKRSAWGTLPNIFETQSRRLNTIHLDSTIIAERVEQSFKFANDSYLVRIHELCVQKMFLNSLSRGIDRKLQAIRDINTDQRDRASSIRMEILEWIIIALIGFDVIPKIVAMVTGLFRH